MPAYANGPFSPNVTTLERGKPGYSLGGFDDQQPQVKALVTSVAVATDEVTLGLTIIEGDAPAAGCLVYVQGTVTDSGGANVSGIALDSASFTGAVGTVTYAATAADQSTTPDVGIAIVLTPETSEDVTTSFIGKQFGVPQASAGRSTGDAISWSYSFPATAPDSVTIALQGANVDVDSQYTTLDSGTSVSGESRPPLSTSGILGFNFLRINVTALAGGPIAVVAKITA